MIMKKTIFTLCAALVSVMAMGQPNTKLRPNETVLLYVSELIENTDPVVGKKITCAGFEMAEDNYLTGPETIQENGNIGNIGANARVDLYFPKKPNGQMVIVCPGGGYAIVSSYNEGTYVAEWMLSKGITVAVVKYRMPNGHWEVPLTDVQNAFRYCREHAEEWKVNQIGVMGFSAGGHLAATASNLYIDEETKPDFSVLVYPVITFDRKLTHMGTHDNLIGKENKWNDKSKSVFQWTKDMETFTDLEHSYSLEKQVTSETPQTFIIHCGDDKTVDIRNTLMYYESLVSQRVPAEVLIYPAGGHGWGFSAEKYVGKGNDKFAYGREEFYSALERWLKDVRE